MARLRHGLGAHARRVASEYSEPLPATVWPRRIDCESGWAAGHHPALGQLCIRNRVLRCEGTYARASGGSCIIHSVGRNLRIGISRVLSARRETCAACFGAVLEISVL